MMCNSHAKNFVRRELRTAFESFSNGFRKFRNWKIEEVFRIFCYIVKFNPFRRKYLCISNVSRIATLFLTLIDY